MKNFYIALLILLPVSLMSYSTVGTIGFMFLTIPPDARGAGLAEALTTGERDGSAGFYNPASIIGKSYYQIDSEKNFLVTFGITKYFADIYCSSFGMSYNFGEQLGAVGIQIQHLGISDMIETSPIGYGFSVDSLGRTGRKFGARDFALGFSYARQVTEELSAGFSLKYVQSNIHNYQANQLIYDIGIQFDPNFKTIRLGMVCRNLGKQTAYIEEEFPLPQKLNFGLSFVPLNVDEHKLWCSIELSNPVYMENHLLVGLEYSYYSFLFCRLGIKPGLYRVQEVDGNGSVIQVNSVFGEEKFSTGLGLKTHYQGRMIINLDYSFTSYNNLNDVHRISLGVDF